MFGQYLSVDVNMSAYTCVDSECEYKDNHELAPDDVVCSSCEVYEHIFGVENCKRAKTTIPPFNDETDENAAVMPVVAKQHDTSVFDTETRPHLEEIIDLIQGIKDISDNIYRPPAHPKKISVADGHALADTKFNRIETVCRDIGMQPPSLRTLLKLMGPVTPESGEPNEMAVVDEALVIEKVDDNMHAETTIGM